MKVFVFFALLILTSGIIFSNQAFAEPLDRVMTSVSEYDGNSASVTVSWNHDNSVFKYKIGCVSCNPNSSEFTKSDRITLNNVTSFPNSSLAMLYVISYNSQNDIISAKQIIVNLNK